MVGKPYINIEGVAEDSNHGIRVMEQLGLMNGMSTALFMMEESEQLVVIVIVIVSVLSLVVLITLVVLFRMWRRRRNEYAWLEETVR